MKNRLGDLVIAILVACFLAVCVALTVVVCRSLLTMVG